MRRCPLIGPRGPGRMLPHRRPMSRSEAETIWMSRSAIKNPTGRTEREKLGHSGGFARRLGRPHQSGCSYRAHGADSRSPRSSTPAVTERAGTAMAPANAACVCCVSGSRSRRVGAPRLAAPRALSCRQGGPSGNRRPPVGTAARRRTGPVSAITRRKPGCRRACIGWQATIASVVPQGASSIRARRTYLSLLLDPGVLGNQDLQHEGSDQHEAAEQQPAHQTRIQPVQPVALVERGIEHREAHSGVRTSPRNLPHAACHGSPAAAASRHGRRQASARREPIPARRSNGRRGGRGRTPRCGRQREPGRRTWRYLV